MIGGFGKMPGDPPGKPPVFPCDVSYIYSVMQCHVCSGIASRFGNVIVTNATSSSLTTISDKHGADIMHSYLGLAALAAMREPQLKSFDPALCLSVCARERHEGRFNLA